jgi:hypothetical protein
VASSAISDGNRVINVDLEDKISQLIRSKKAALLKEA